VQVYVGHEYLKLVSLSKELSVRNSDEPIRLCWTEQRLFEAYCILILNYIYLTPPQSLCDECCSYVIYVMRPKFHIKKQAVAHIGSLFRENSACTVLFGLYLNTHAGIHCKSWLVIGQCNVIYNYSYVSQTSHDRELAIRPA
jgi:hypothetical protein